jgi:regulator of cell morphogenesis and NO signaling
MGTPSSEAPVGRLVAERPARAEVFERFGIDYCCEGRLSVAEACARAGADAGDLLRALVEWDARPAPPDEPDFASLGLEQLLDRILDTHHAFLHRELKPLGMLAHRVAAAHADTPPELGKLAHAYDYFREDLEAHLLKEEEVLFPALRELAGAQRLPSYFQGDLHVPLLVMEGDHQRAEQSLRFFRSATRGYVAPPEACDAWRSLAARLLALERDLHRHMHVENEVLHPRLREMTRQ